MKITITTTDNAAFYDDYEGELKRLVLQAVKKVVTGGGGVLRDINGNKVGECEGLTLAEHQESTEY